MCSSDLLAAVLDGAGLPVQHEERRLGKCVRLRLRMRLVDVHNLKITADLTRKGMQPNPAQCSRGMPRPLYWEYAAFGVSNV